MKPDLMNSDSHEPARRMIALSGPEGVSGGRPSPAEESWLAAHLDSCPPCRDFAENSREAVRALRGIPISAGASLVATTQLRVRQRALQLQRRQERLWVICVCCAAVTLCTAVTTVVLWRGFAWLGERWLSAQWMSQAQFSEPFWQVAFVVFSLMPAVLAGILLLARGTSLADHHGSYQD